MEILLQAIQLYLSFVLFRSLPLNFRPFCNSIEVFLATGILRENRNLPAKLRTNEIPTLLKFV